MDLFIHRKRQNIGPLTPEQAQQGLQHAPSGLEDCAAQTDVTLPHGASFTKQRFSVSPKLALFGACSLGLLFISSSHAQNLKPAEKAKVSALKARLTKADTSLSTANATISRYRVFFVAGKVQAGDNISARLYGHASLISGASGAGSISDDTLLFVKSPVNDNYKGSMYIGNCTFLGVRGGFNTYLPVERQPELMAAYSAKEKWDKIVASIEAEIEAVYLPYRKEAKAQAATEAKQQAQEVANQEAKQLQAIEDRKHAAIEVLQRTPSVIAGEQLGKIRLGMTQSEVVQLMGTPSSSLQLRKVTPYQEDDQIELYTEFKPRSIRRDRYALKAIPNLDIFYRWETLEPSDPIFTHYMEEKMLEEQTNQGQNAEVPEAGILKKDFVFDVFYVGDKVVQLESDSPQFFTPDQKNIESSFTFENGYDSGFIIDYSTLPKGGSWNGNSNQIRHGSRYFGSREKGLSVSLSNLSAVYPKEPKVTLPYSPSYVKLIVHLPNTYPYTGDYQLGISISNKAAGRSDAENVEERKYNSYAPFNSR